MLALHNVMLTPTYGSNRASQTNALWIPRTGKCRVQRRWPMAWLTL